MKKAKIIRRINSILNTHGSFSIDELEGHNSLEVDKLGNYICMAEHFTENYIEVNVYEPNSNCSDPIYTYEQNYWDLDETVLEDVLLLCEQLEVDWIKTEKRISN